MESNNPYSKVFKKWYKKGGKKYYMKSKWEYNYACYLDLLKDNKVIKDWEYEPDTFTFDKIKYGIRRYTPDFKIYETNGIINYIEIKGWMDGKSKTKISRFRRYYPDKRLHVVQRKEYNAIKKISKIISGWIS